jgi:antibiotic biosynthesis monooxygenase (ABM) superfamily enzyme
MTMNNNIQHKRAFLTWLAIYPVITILFWLFGDLLIKIPLVIRTLILTLALVPLLSYIILPFYHKVFTKWLNGK